MSSTVSGAQIAHVEDEDERGQPVYGTKHFAVSVAGRRLDARSDSGYSSHTQRTLASADSAKAPPQAPDPPAPDKVAAAAPSAALLADREPRPASPSKKHHRASSKTSKPSRASRSSRSSRSHLQPQRCHDQNCTLDHYETPYLPSPVDGPAYYTPQDRRYPPPVDPRHPYAYATPPLPIEYTSPPDRTLRRASRTRRPSTYHEDMSADLSLMANRLGRLQLHRGSDPEDPGHPAYYHPSPNYAISPSHDPYSLRTSYFDREASRPPLRHSITDGHPARPQYVDPVDPYQARLSGNLLEYGTVDGPSRRRSVHGQPYASTRASRSPRRVSRDLVPRHQEPISYFDSMPLPPRPGDAYPRWTPAYLEYDHPVSPHGEYYVPPGENAYSHSRTRSAARIDYEGANRTSRRSSLASQDRRMSHTGEYPRRRMSSTRRSVSPGQAQALRDSRSGRRPSHSSYYEKERRVRRDSSREYSPTEDKAAEALKYQDQVRGGPTEDDLASTLRQMYGTSSTKRPAMIAAKQPSITSRTSSRSHQKTDTRSRSSRRNSDYHVRVAVISDGEEVQSYRVPIRSDKPVHFTVDGLDPPAAARQRALGSNSRWSWFTGSGRSRAASEHDADDRRGRRRLSIRSPIIEGTREDHWGGSRR